MKRNRAQAAIEFLSTYSWAFIGVLIAVGALVYFDVLDISKFVDESCNTGAQVKCLEAEVIEGTGASKINLENNFLSDITVREIKYSVDGREYTSTPTIPYIPEGHQTLLDGPSLASLGLVEGTTKDIDVRITYTKRGGTRQYTVSGKALLKVKSAETATITTCDRDNICDPGENSGNCPYDCPLPIECGDSICDLGESSSCPADCVMQDTQAPIVTSIHSPSNPSSSNDVVVSATAVDDSNIAYINIWVDGVMQPACNNQNTCQTTPRTYSTGTHYYYVQATDQYGYVGKDPLQIDEYNHFQVDGADTTPPTVNVWHLLINPSVGDPMTYYVSADDGSVPSTVASTSIFVATRPDLTDAFLWKTCPLHYCEFPTSYLTVGPRYYYATATDLAGNTGRDPLGTASKVVNIGAGFVCNVDGFCDAAAGENSQNCDIDCGPITDFTGPTIIVTANPSSPTVGQLVNYTASATDPSGISIVSIMVDGVVQNSCPFSPCKYEVVYTSTGTHEFNASASDVLGNIGRDPASGKKDLVVIRGIVCGDALCETGETELNCRQDCPAVLDTILSNPSFESGTSSWASVSDGTASYSVSNIEGDSFHLSNGAKYGIISPGTNVQLYQTGFQIMSNSQYLLSFYAKSNNSHDLKVTLQNGSSPYMSWGLPFQLFDLTNVWAEHTTIFTTPNLGSSPTTQSKLMFWFADNDVAGEIYSIDRVVLRKIGLAPDTTPPTVSVTHSPSPINPVIGQPVTYTATASDAGGLRLVNLYVDNVLRCSLSYSPCTFTTSYSAEGMHTYYANASDAAGYVGRNPSSGTKSVTIGPVGPVCDNDGFCDAGETADCPDCSACPIDFRTASQIDTTGGSRGRPRIVNNNLVADNGYPLRGELMIVTNWNYDRIMNDAVWLEMRDTYHLNTVRLQTYQVPCPTCSPGEIMTADEIMPLLDAAISQAVKFGMYAVIDYHTNYGGFDRTHCLQWWTKIAPRYANNPNVIYEVAQEQIPTPAATDDDHVAFQKQSYQLIRQYAPNTPIMLWNFFRLFWGVNEKSVSVTPTNVMTTAVDRGGTSEISYSNAVISWHSYPQWSLARGELADLDALDRVDIPVHARQKYPMIMGEIAVLDPLDGVSEGSANDAEMWDNRTKVLEDNCFSWILFGAYPYVNGFTNYIKKMDITWPKDPGLVSAPIPDTQPPTVTSLDASPTPSYVNLPVTYKAMANDNVGVTTMSIVIDEGTANEIVHTCTSVSSCQYSVTYSTTGTHYYYATASDAAGNGVRIPTSGTRAVYISPGTVVCDYDNTCEPPGENSANCADCVISSTCDNDGVCELGEYSVPCAADCYTPPLSDMLGMPLNPAYPDLEYVPEDNLLFRAGYLDATLYPGVDPTGTYDSTVGLQNAINDGYEYLLPVYLPAGTYLVSNTLKGDQISGSDVGLASCADAYWNTEVLFGQQNAPGLVGAKGSSRPIIRLKPNSPGFNNPSSLKAVVHFRNVNEDSPDGNEGSTSWLGDMDCGMFMTFRGIDIEIGSGNSGAVGLAIPSAQYTTVEDVRIDATDAYAGLRGGLTTSVMVNLEVVGGRYGVIIKDASDVTISGLTLRDQTIAGFESENNAMATVIGFDIEQPASGYAVRIDHFTEQGGITTLSDGIIRVTNSGSPVIYNPKQENLYLGNVYMNGAGLVSENGGAASRSIGSGWQHIEEYAYTDPSSLADWGDASVLIDSWKLMDGVSSKADRWVVASGSPPSNLVSRHTYSDIPWFMDADAKWVSDSNINAKGDGVTDDSDAIQYAIDNYEKVFLPRGDYVLSKPLILHANTKLFGVSSYRTRLNPEFTPPGGQEMHAIQTDQAANGEAYLGDIWVHIPTGYSRSSVGAVYWRVGRKSLVRQVSVGTSFENEQESLVRTNFRIESTGGGRWYGINMEDGSRSRNSDFRQVLVKDTTEPLTFYGLNMEHSGGDYLLECTNSENVRLIGAKSEPVYVWGLFENSNNIFVGGITSNIGWHSRNILDFVDSTNVLVPNIYVLIGRHYQLTGNMLKEQYGGSTYYVTGDDNVNLFRRGNFDYTVFNP